jgi:endonuclease/exonuclease/phosphatase family metal-dependent hydrolase
MNTLSFYLRFSLCLLGLTLPAAAATSLAAAPRTLEIMTFNMEHHNAPEELRAIAAHLKTDLSQLPDFILCQEVVFSRHTTKDNPEDNTAAILARHLGYYSHGTKRTSDHEGIAIISKYPFDHYESINLKSQTPRILLGFRRVSVMGEFTVPGMGKVRVADTHLTNWEFETFVRRAQIAETLQWVSDREKAAPAAYTFFGGDFNAKINWSEMQLVSTDGLSYTNNNGTAYSQGSHGHPSKRIDFIFLAAAQKAAAGLKFAGEQLLWKQGLIDREGSHFYPSDHLAVVQTYAVDPAVMAAMNHSTIHTADARD